MPPTPESLSSHPDCPFDLCRLAGECLRFRELGATSINGVETVRKTFTLCPRAEEVDEYHRGIIAVARQIGPPPEDPTQN